jgi:hypothetical protein
MVKDAAEVLRDALALPSEARAALIDSMIESLDHTVDEGAEEAWREEIHRRLQQIDLSPGRTLVSGSELDRVSPSGPLSMRVRVIPAGDRRASKIHFDDGVYKDPAYRYGTAPLERDRAVATG